MRGTGARVFALALLAAGCSHGASGRAAPPMAERVPRPAAGEVEVTIFLIGDAGAPARDSEPVLLALRRDAAPAANPVIVFLGDNVYPHGLPDSTSPRWAEAERRLRAQLDVVRAAGASGILVPGNHDWDRQGTDGWEAVRRQAGYVAAQRDPRIAVLPTGGCPGPTVVDLSGTVRLVVLDTQWWLHEGAKPREPTSNCSADSEGEVLDAVSAALRTRAGRHAVVVGHHPLVTGGVHGGHFGWQHHLFPLREWKSWLWIPLPLVGSVYPLSRQAGVSNQDVSGPLYRRMRQALDSVFRETPPLAYAAGHDHGLQVVRGTSAQYFLVSGAGSYGHLSRVASLDSTRYAASRSGYMRLDVLRDGRVRLGVIVVDARGRGVEAFAAWLEERGRTPPPGGERP